jgi:hypothetical protein
MTKAIVRKAAHVLLTQCGWPYNDELDRGTAAQLRALATAAYEAADAADTTDQAAWDALGAAVAAVQRVAADVATRWAVMCLMEINHICRHVKHIAWLPAAYAPTELWGEP